MYTIIKGRISAVIVCDGLWSVKLRFVPVEKKRERQRLYTDNYSIVHSLFRAYC
jgi:hypothetical protein